MKTTHHCLAIVAIVLVFSPTARLCQAVQLDFTLDPGASSLALVADFIGFDLEEQAPGSLTTTYSGTFAVDVDDAAIPTSIDFLNASLIAANSGNWLPEAGGGPSGGNAGTAQPANYGGIIESGGFLAGDVLAAIRGFELDMATPGGALAVAGGAFPSTQTFTITAGMSDFNLEGGLLAGADASFSDLAGDSSPNMGANSTYSLVGSIVTLTLPVDVDIDIVTSAGNGAANVSGTLVATADISNADFDGDGNIDGADFLLWQRGGSTNPLDPADLALWQADYGASPGPLSAITAVPEPSTLALFAIASMLLPLRAKEIDSKQK